MHDDDDGQIKIIRGVFSTHSCRWIIIIINKIRYLVVVVVVPHIIFRIAYDFNFFLLQFYELRIWFDNNKYKIDKYVMMCAKR